MKHLSLSSFGHPNFLLPLDAERLWAKKWEWKVEQGRGRVEAREHSWLGGRLIPRRIGPLGQEVHSQYEAQT